MSPPRASPQPAYIHLCAPERARRQQGNAHRPPVHSEVGISFFDKQDGLGRPRSALNLDPAAAITWRKRARPQAHLFCPQSRVRYFKNDAAHIFVSEEIVARELQ